MQGHLLLPPLLNIELGVLDSAVMQRKESIQFGKKEVEVSLFTDNIILHVENPKEPTQNYYN